MLESNRVDASCRSSYILTFKNVPFELMKIIISNKNIDLSRGNFCVFFNAVYEENYKLVDMLMKDHRIDFGKLINSIYNELYSMSPIGYYGIELYSKFTLYRKILEEVLSVLRGHK